MFSNESGKGFAGMSVCIVSFSARKGGNCAAVSELIRSLIPGAEKYDFSEFAIHPCGACQYECFIQGDLCPWISDQEYALLEAISRSSLTYFVLPDYSDYPCANFFIFNERGLCYFQGHEERLEAYERVPKRAVVVSNGSGENFRMAMRYHADQEPPMLLLSARRYGKNSLDGDLLTSEQAVAELKSFVLGDSEASLD